MRPLPLLLAKPPSENQELQARARHKDHDHAHEELRRFAPRALADRIDRGQNIDTGEQEVSVMFADLRGYSAFAESRRPREVFRTVSCFAELVSRVVTDYGGMIVEFCGDGVMAVFGALEAHPSKERAALAAAREIYTLVACDSHLDLSSGRSMLSVGVGVATGEAYVGEIRAGDRTFWSAVGTTTNLAARLQHLTRQFPCAIAVDAKTCRQAGELAVGLKHRPGVSIRGHVAPQDVYFLPMEPS